jgi:hypothetical protein
MPIARTCARTRSVVDDHRHAEFFRQPAAIGTCCRIGRAAGRIRNDHADRPRRIRALRGMRGRGGEQAHKGKDNPPSAVNNHGLSSNCYSR